MPLDAARIGADGCRLLRSPAFPKNKTGLQVSEIAGAEFLHGDRLVVELAIFDGIVTPSDAADLNLRLSASGLRSPGAMKPNRVASGTAARAILDDVTALARGEGPDTEARQFVIPD